MALSDRINEWVEGRRAAWGSALGDFLLESIASGGTKMLEDFEPDAIDSIKEILTKVKDDPNTPDELKAMIEKVLVPGNPLVVVLGVLFVVAMMSGTLNALFAPLNRITEYKVDRGVESFRLDPQTITAAWLRDKPRYEKLWDDLAELGWNDEKIAVAKELAKILPPLADMVRFADFGSFDPKIIELWRQFYDAPGWITEPMSLLGITNEEGRDWANKYWFSHWRQPGRFELGEIYRRGLLGEPLIGQDEIGGGATVGPAEELVKNAYLTQGFSSFWQDHLLELVREIPTRVDIRRWWDMRTIDETELRSLYQRHGYFGKDLENYVIWTKVYVAFPDLMARWTKGWITLDDVRSQLTGLGMPPDRVEEMIQMKVKAEQPERTAKDREITITDIYKGVRLEQITRDEGIELLQELGFDEDEADYKLAVNVPEDKVESVVKDRELTKADIIAGLRAEVITEDEARSRLLAKRYKAVDVQLLLDIFKATIKPPTEPREREASKTDIIKAVKKGLISPEEGYLMLQDIGFTPEASEFILDVHVEESPFSPINYPEFKDLTQKYRLATGREVKPMPEELKQAAAEVVRLTDEVASLQLAIEEEEAKLIPDEVLPEAATERLTELQVSLHRAQAELSRVRTDYKIKLAEWHQER